MLPLRPHPLVIFALGTLITATASWVPSYWNDEAATLRLARLPLGELIAFVQHKDAVHAAYALLMHGWIGLFGESEFAVRLPSALAIGAAAAGILVLLRELDRPRAALLAAIVFTLLPRSSFNGVEARSSALATALVVWGAVCVVRAAVHGRWWRWAFVAIAVGASVAVFLYAALVIPALLVLAFAASRGTETVVRTAVVRTAVASIVGVGLASPVIVVAAGQSSQVGWLSSQPVNLYTVVVEPFFGSSWWLAGLVIGLLVCGVVSRATSNTYALVLACATWIVVPAAVLLAASALISPLFTPRYLSVSSPAIAIIGALVLSSWRRRAMIAAAVALTLAAAPAFVEARTPLGKPGGQDLRGLAHLLQQQAEPGDAIVLGDRGTVSLRPRIALAAYPDAFAELDDVALIGSYADMGTYSDRLIGGDALVARLASERRVWVVTPASGASSISDARLSEAGFERTRVQRVPTMTITLWTSAVQ
ncbi:Mannosyltransferase [Agreia sp. COWG]|nr:Mannosyltransferase [Agreia sp. COWG]